MKFLRRLSTLTRVELGHALLGKIEEHRLPIRSLVKYEGPVEALKVLRKERDDLLRYRYRSEITAEAYAPWKPMKFSKKRWRKDSQIFFP